jgi:hypothetical protein
MCGKPDLTPIEASGVGRRAPSACVGALVGLSRVSSYAKRPRSKQSGMSQHRMSMMHWRSQLRSTRTRTNSTLSLLLIAAVTACGGGGGNGGSPAASIPPPPPPPETVPLAFTMNNYGPATELTATVAEAVLQLGQLATDAVDQLRANPQNSTVLPCANGGTLDLVLTDNNADGVPNSGDSVHASYHNCFQPSVDDAVNGDITVSLTTAPLTVSMDNQPSYVFDLQFGASFTLGVAPSTTASSGNLAVSLTRDSLTTTLAAASSTADDLNFTVSQNGKTYVEAPRSLRLTKKLDYGSATFELRLAMTYRSQALGGMLTLTTPDYMGGFFNTYPTIGWFDIAGAVPNTARLRVGGAYVIPGNDQSTINLSADNFQTDLASQTYAWATFTAGFLWWEPLSYPGAYPNGYAPQSLSTITPFPALLFTRPVNGGVWPANLPIYMQYNVPVANSSTTTALLYPVTPAGPDVPVTLSFQGARIVAMPQQALQSGTTYSFDLSSSNPAAAISQFTVR